MHNIPLSVFLPLEKKFSEIESRLSSQDWKDQKEYVDLTRNYVRLQETFKLKEEGIRLLSQLKNNQELITSADQDEEMQAMIQDDISQIESKLAQIEKKLMQKLLPPDPNSGRPIIMEIRAGTGGEEASLFAGELLRMYQKYCERKQLGVEILDISSTGVGGVKEVIFGIKGDSPWDVFKYESGTHRVQRVPVTETQGRVHTSAITVAILVEPEEVDIDIEPKDLRIDVFRSSGAGGQHVNTTDSAVRITHIPTNVVVTCQDERSQHKNKAKAMRILRARLLEKIQEDEDKKNAHNRRIQVGSGDRSEKIRTYNFPQNRLTDHRIHYTAYNLDEVMEGILEDLFLALAEFEFKKCFENIS